MAQPTKVFIADLPPSFDEGAAGQIFGAYGTITAVRMLPPRSPGDRAACILDFADPSEAAWIVNNLNGNMPEGLGEPISVRFANSWKGKGKGKEQPQWEASQYGQDWSGQGDEVGNGYEDMSYGKAKGKGPFWGKSGPYNGKGGKKGKDGIYSLIEGVTKGGLLPDNGQRPDENCLYIRGLPPDTTDLDLFKLFSVFGAIPPRGVKAMLNPDGTCTSIGFVDFVDAMAAQAAIAALNGYELPDGKSLFLKTKNPAGSGKGGKGYKDGFKGKQPKGKGYAPPEYDMEVPPPPEVVGLEAGLDAGLTA